MYSRRYGCFCGGSQTLLIQAASSDRNYLYKCIPFLDSVQKNSNADRIILFCVNFSVVQDFIDKYNRIEFITISSDKFKKPLSNNCIQHGEFLQFIECAAEDIIIFTDCDIVMQREIDTEELSLFHDIKKDQILIQYNAGPSDTLWNEFERLQCQMSKSFLDTIYDSSFPMFNSGMLIMQYQAYVELYNLYCKEFNKISRIIEHDAKQQWLESFLINKYFEPIMVDISIHAHAHFGVPPNITHENNEFKYNGKTILFAHVMERLFDKELQEKYYFLDWGQFTINA
jgi:hypothetical protein